MVKSLSNLPTLTARGTAAAAAFSFVSCKKCWYYRCLGLDP